MVQLNGSQHTQLTPITLNVQIGEIPKMIINLYPLISNWNYTVPSIRCSNWQHNGNHYCLVLKRTGCGRDSKDRCPWHSCAIGSIILYLGLYSHLRFPPLI